MDQKRPNQRPQKLDTQGVRGLVFALAISSTIGFWAIFSRIDGIKFSGAEVPAQTTSELPLVQEEGQMMVSLPPIPTLVPPLDSSITAPVVAAGLPTPVTLDLGNANLPVITLPGDGKSNQRGVNKDPVKPKKNRGSGGGGGTTSTRSSK